MNRRRILITLAVGVTVMTVALLITVAAWWRTLNQPLSASVYEVVVTPGMSFNRLLGQLHSDGVLPQTIALRLWARVMGQEGSIKAGEYSIEPGTSALGLMDKLLRGEVKQYRLTLVEGWTFSEALQLIQKSPRITSTVQILSPSELARALDVELLNAEGWLFPDTYNYGAGTTDLEILRRAYRRMQSLLEQSWSTRDLALPLQSPYEALILASIVERETAVPAERTLIAGVFTRRLENGMRLQSDPTVIYGLGALFDGNLRREDLQDANNPYNTYRNNGLPPTPIALPGLAALEAVMHPDASSNLYFVAKGDGTHYFSSTLEEHNEAVRRYQLAIPGI